MSLREGLVVDRYVVERPIGRGGTAEVWSVRHRTLGTRRALKVLFLTGGDLPARLIEEGRAQAQLSNDHIVPVLDVLDVEGAPALVMPLIEGPSLARLLEVHRPSEAEAAAIMRALLDGVRTAHEAGLVHRDLKPANVLLDLTSGGVRPRIADFGIARSAKSDVTQAGAVLGTPAYAAPEQLRDSATVDARADFWSVGVMLYQLLTGTVPFRGDDLLALVRAMEAETFPPLGGDPRWMVLVRDLLRARPEARLSDFEEIHNRIDAISPSSDRSPLAAGTPFAGVAWRIRAPEPVGAPTVGVTGGTTHPPPTGVDNLPRERDAFVGRSAEAATLRAQLERSSLVTVTGPGGVGKTRLVLHVARPLRDEFSEVAFCDLTDARSVDAILAAVARGLDVALGADPIAQLGHAIAGRGRFLLVLDNFEQVVEHAAATAGVWMDRAPDAVFLVTSREPLRLRGESVFPLDVLSLPLAGSPTIDDSEAVRLFVIRAQQSNPSFRIAEDNASTVAQLVRRLDGLPLAIELAAARVRSSTPARLLDRLSKRFELLAGAARDVADRQRSLRATLDWSWEQLSSTLQDTLAQLSVFEGGWTLEAAESVVRLGGAAPAVEELLAELVDRSLVRADLSVPAGPSRFGMLVSVHEYATEKRLELERADEAAVRHAAWFARFGTPEAIESLYVHGGVARGVALDRELDNLVAACNRAVKREDGAVAAALLESAWAVLQDRGPLAVGVALGERILHLSSLHARERASTAFVLGSVLVRAGRGDEGRAQLEAALALARAVGDRRREAIVLTSLGAVCREKGRTEEARAHFDAALSAGVQLGDRRRECVVLSNVSILDRDQGHVADAGAHGNAALTLAREVGDRRTEGVVLAMLGVLQHERGRMDDAGALYDASLAVAREVGDRRREGIVSANLGKLHYDQGRMDDARLHLESALAIARDLGNRRTEAFATGNLGNLFRVRGEHGPAIQHLAHALAIHREVGFTMAQPSWLGGRALAEADAGRRDEALALALEAVAVAVPFPLTQREALGTLARVHLARQEVAAAREAIVRARTLGEQPDAGLAAVDALVAVAEGDCRAAQTALKQATADTAQCLPGTEVAHLVAKARAALDSLASGASSS